MVGQFTFSSIMIGLLLVWFWGMSMANPITWLVVLFVWPFVLIFKIVMFSLPLITVIVLVGILFAVYHMFYRRY